MVPVVMAAMMAEVPALLLLQLLLLIIVTTANKLLATFKNRGTHAPLMNSSQH
jgi:hypothetical protein